MSNATQIRLASPDDAVTVAALATQVFLDTYATEGVRPDLAREAFHVCSPQAFTDRIEDPRRKIVLAEQGEALLGFAEVLCVPMPMPAGDGAGAELVRLYVQPGGQQRGIGRRLIGEAERMAAEASLPVLWLTVWDRNARALAFYRRMGYADAGSTTYTFEGRDYGNRVFAKTLQT